VSFAEEAWFEYECHDTVMSADLQKFRKRDGNIDLSLSKKEFSNRHVEGCSTCRTTRVLQYLLGNPCYYLNIKPLSIRTVVSGKEIAADLKENPIDRI
tara:strand:- start:1899 stop:2192 length:294 start_codon:yes stop_codon:yes gene_type:complete